MDRLQQLRRFASRDRTGIEIAPYFNPIVRKSDGYTVMIMDVFDAVTLRENARKDPLIPDRRIDEIEPVDIVGDACSLGDAVRARDLSGKVHYIVSSHNFEHLADPIRFLQGCSVALAPGGTVTMAIPDGRACFDHFRMPTRLVDWLAAHHRRHRQPTPETHFDNTANFAWYMVDGRTETGCDIAVADPHRFAPPRGLEQAYARYLADLAEPGSYRDTHCSVVFGATFELMVRDLRHLGLIDLEVIEVTPTMGSEFFAHLRKPEAPQAPSAEAFWQRRDALLTEIGRGMGVAGYGAYGPVWRDGGDLPRHKEVAEMEERLHQAQSRCAMLEARIEKICRRPWRPVRDLARYRLKTLVASLLAPLAPAQAAALRASASRHDPARLRA